MAIWIVYLSLWKLSFVICIIFYFTVCILHFSFIIILNKVSVFISMEAATGRSLTNRSAALLKLNFFNDTFQLFWSYIELETLQNGVSLSFFCKNGVLENFRKTHRKIPVPESLNVCFCIFAEYLSQWHSLNSND